MSPANAPRPCPYCDHLSPPDSKFCNECGAALHLQPCPHCGSVNDITKSSVCGRCHGDLQLLPGNSHADTQPADEEPSLAPPEPAPKPAAAAALVTPPDAERLPQAQPEFLAPQRSPALPLILLAVLLGAGYFAYQAWTPAADTRPPAKSSESSSTDASTSPAARRPPAAVAAPAPEQSRPAEAAASNNETLRPLGPGEAGSAATGSAIGAAIGSAASPKTEPSGLLPPAVPRASNASNASGSAAKPMPRPVAKTEPDSSSSTPPPAPLSSRQRSEALQGLDLKKPQIKQCTDAVAALGLCAPETQPRSP